MKPAGRLDARQVKEVPCKIRLDERPVQLSVASEGGAWRSGGTRMNARELSLAIVFAALYAVLVMVFGIISYGPVQLRVADALIALAALFGGPVILGVSLGALIGNTYTNVLIYWIGPVDILFGPVANLISASLIFALRRRRFLACLVGALPIGLIVGSYLSLFFPPPEAFDLNLPPWLAMVISITLSSLVAIAGIGYVLLNALSRPGIVKPLTARGLRLYLPRVGNAQGT